MEYIRLVALELNPARNRGKRPEIALKALSETTARRCCAPVNRIGAVPQGIPESSRNGMALVVQRYSFDTYADSSREG